MAKTAQQMAAAWSAAMMAQTTAQKYKAGIMATQVNPMALAASPAAQQKYLNSVTQAVQSGRMANKLNSVSMQTWQSNAANIGSANLTSGAQKAQQKVAAFFNTWAPIFAQASAAAKAIPNDGSDMAIQARVMASINVLRQAAGKQ